MAQNDLSFSLPVFVTKQGKRFVAYTPALDIATSGKSEKDVRNKFVELANIFFEEITEAGTANDVLTELGWKRVEKRWTPPKVVSSRPVGFCIPAFV